MSIKEIINMLQKVNLNGAVDMSVWEIKDNTLFIRFYVEEKQIWGGIKVIDFELPDATFGVYDETAKLIKSLKALGPNVFSISMEKPYLIFHIDHLNYHQTICDPSTITIPKMKRDIEYDTEVKISRSFNKMVSSNANAVLSDLFCIDVKNSEIEFRLGNNSFNQSSVSFTLPCTECKNFTLANFNLKVFRSILSTNKDCLRSKIRVHSNGVLNIQYTGKEFYSEYYLFEKLIH